MSNVTDCAGDHWFWCVRDITYHVTKVLADCVANDTKVLADCVANVTKVLADCVANDTKVLADHLAIVTDPFTMPDQSQLRPIS